MEERSGGGHWGTGESEAGLNDEWKKEKKSSYLALLIRNITQL
jgi:hypothetical protein